MVTTVFAYPILQALSDRVSQLLSFVGLASGLQRDSRITLSLNPLEVNELVREREFL